MRGQIRSFIPPGTAPCAAGQVVIFNCRSTGRHALRQPEREGRGRQGRPKWLSRISIVKKNRRKPQTSQDKAVATNYHNRQTSGKNPNREYFTIHFHNFFHCFLGNGVQRKLSWEI
jgi:hypothetical protein